MRADLDWFDISEVASGERLPSVPPGEVLRLEFMAPLGLTASVLARQSGLSPSRVSGILNGTRPITAEAALRLAARLGTTPEFWMNLQTAHDLELARARISPAA